MFRVFDKTLPSGDLCLTAYAGDLFYAETRTLYKRLLHNELGHLVGMRRMHIMHGNALGPFF
jgi:hypothetical protein